jgi:phosphoribosylformylglycinamidine (FGAM) synthase-like amidotransferase family enzyme
MSDLIAGRANLADFKGFVACGGFSYGDVLGAGEGWAKTILFNGQMAEQFAAFFNRQDTFALGVCNGCQMMSNLAPIIPGAGAWPKFTRNQSEQFEARCDRRSAAVAVDLLRRHGRQPHSDRRGARRRFADFSQQGDIAKANVALRFVDNRGAATQTYPLNPNGSPEGITSVTTVDGRFTALMPHPAVFRTATMSWAPDAWKQIADGGGPWMRISVTHGGGWAVLIQPSAKAPDYRAPFFFGAAVCIAGRRSDGEIRVQATAVLGWSAGDGDEADGVAARTPRLQAGAPGQIPGIEEAQAIGPRGDFDFSDFHEGDRG